MQEHFQRIGPDAFAEALGSERPPFVLDVRDLDAFASGHVPGSRHVPVHEMARRPRDLPQSKVARIIVVGDPGKRAVAAANWLFLMGFADVALLDGGLPAWTGPLETGAASATASANARPGPVLRVIPNEPPAG